MGQILDMHGRPLGPPTRKQRRSALNDVALAQPDTLAGVLARLQLGARDDFADFLLAERDRATRIDLVLQAACMSMADDIVLLAQRLGRSEASSALAFLQNLSGLVQQQFEPPADAGSESGEVLEEAAR